MLHKYLLSTLMFILLGAGLAHASMDDYLKTLRVSAAADFGDFRASLGAHYGASGAELDHLFLAVGDRGDAAVCLWLARRTGYPVDYVAERYRKHKGQGWGALAQSLGIKPGSADFKALKAGQLGWYPKDRHRGGYDDDDHYDDHGRRGKDDHGGKGKDKGNDKGKKK